MKAGTLEKRFEPLQAPVSIDEAAAEASRCLFCYDAPCTEACPTHISVPDFVRKISTRNLKGAARLLYESNYLAGGCARVCPTDELCEGACVLNKLQGRPLQIARLQRFATDWAIKNRINVLSPGPPTGRRIAVIGAGPAGFSCAAELARLGHKVTIFEAREKPGGLYTYAIARYKLTSAFTRKELAMLKRLGITLKPKIKVGVDIPFDELLEKYDAVFLGIGRGRTASLNIPGEGLRGVPGEFLPGVIEGLSFVEKVRTIPLEKIHIGRQVVVIGGGNTAINSALAAVRLGANEVTVVYRRTATEMPAHKREFDLAKLEGVHFIWLAAPVRIIGRRRVERIKCIRMRLGKPDASGRPRPIPIKGSEFTIECDTIIEALGQKPLEDVLSKIPELKLKSGLVVTDAKTGATSVPKLYAGGDCTSGGGEVVNAVSEGIRAARSIDAEILLYRGH